MSLRTFTKSQKVWVRGFGLPWQPGTYIEFIEVDSRRIECDMRHFWASLNKPHRVRSVNEPHVTYSYGDDEIRTEEEYAPLAMTL